MSTGAMTPCARDTAQLPFGAPWATLKGMRAKLSILALLVMTGCGSQPGAAGGAAAPNEEVIVAADSELGRAMRDVPVAMYMTHWCPVCTRASEWLQANGFRVVEFNVEADEHASRIHLLLNPRGSVPTFDIDGTTMVGFSARGFELVVARLATLRQTQNAPIPATK